MNTNNWLDAARNHWQWRGQARPSFAVAPQPGQVSVWDYPRPPLVVMDRREVIICWGGNEIARSKRCILVQETAHPPSFYIPLADVAAQWLQPGEAGSFCEWKGPAQYWSLHDPANVHGTGHHTPPNSSLPNVAWSYPKPLAGAQALAHCVAFYPAKLQCTVAGAAVLAQPGGFYGGWITPELVGPFKGAPGSSGW